MVECEIGVLKAQHGMHSFWLRGMARTHTNFSAVRAPGGMMLQRHTGNREITYFPLADSQGQLFRLRTMYIPELRTLQPQ